MFYFFKNFDNYDYFVLYRFLLGFFIIFGSLILRTIEYNKSKFLKNDRGLLIVFVFPNIQ